MLDASEDHVVYTLRQVEVLLGLHESRSPVGRRHVTIADLLSWAADPGASGVYYAVALRDDPGEAWMARRGPLAPDGDLAMLLYDFERAMMPRPSSGTPQEQRRQQRVALMDSAIVALVVMGFGSSEIAEVLDLDTKELDHHLAESRRKRVERRIHGREVRDAGGKTVYADSGEPLRQGGIVRQLTTRMNGA